MFKLKEFLVVFGFGAIIYSAIEVLYRGFTHWTMTLTGGVVFLLLYVVNVKMKSTSLILRCLVGCFVITSTEFAVGLIVNKLLMLNVWDYSDQSYNILGQICPLFTLLWFFLCFPATFLSLFISKNLSSQKHLKRLSFF